MTADGCVFCQKIPLMSIYVEQKKTRGLLGTFGTVENNSFHQVYPLILRKCNFTHATTGYYYRANFTLKNWSNDLTQSKEGQGKHTFHHQSQNKPNKFHI